MRGHASAGSEGFALRGGRWRPSRGRIRRPAAGCASAEWRDQVAGRSSAPGPVGWGAT